MVSRRSPGRPELALEPGAGVGAEQEHHRGDFERIDARMSSTVSQRRRSSAGSETSARHQHDEDPFRAFDGLVRDQVPEQQVDREARREQADQEPLPSPSAACRVAGSARSRSS
jgi:hypothetical protein